MSLLLSLCVPTYNRAALLDQSLRAILSQITQAISKSVEVVVLDNASPDNTPQVVEKIQTDFPHVPFRYLRRSRNIGPDANFTDALTQARGEFLYLLSDDDVLLPGAVETLLRLIQTHPNLDAFALNVRVFTDDPYHDLDKPPAYTIPEDVLLPDRDAALSLLRMHLTFLSCIAFRRTNVLGRNYSKRYGTVLAQAYMFLDALAPGNGLYAVKQPFLARREDNNEGFDFFQVFVTNFHPVMQYAEQIGYSPQAVQKVRDNNLVFLRYCILLFKTKGTIGTIRPNYWDSLKRLRRAGGPYTGMLLMLAPMMLLPRPLFRGFYWIYKSIKSRAGEPEPSPQRMQ